MKGTVQQRENRPSPEQARQRMEYLTPVVNIFETKEGYVLEAEMPGVSKAGLEITLEGNDLTILGHKTEVTLPGEALLKECSTAGYLRVFELDPAIDTAKIAAKMEQGILVLNLPKSEQVKPRKISVE
jgi:HSP20 family protein